MSKITDYFKEVKAEMVHVTWPSRKQTTLFTFVVIAISLIVAIYLGLLDYVIRIGFGKLF
ncbi:MAG: preprotein translocase subunit SecE [Patescibacteria group bacterium]